MLLLRASGTGRETAAVLLRASPLAFCYRMSSPSSSLSGPAASRAAVWRSAGGAATAAASAAALLTLLATAAAVVVWRRRRMRSSDTPPPASASSDPRAALYSMAAYTQLTLQQAQTLTDAFLQPTQQIGSTADTAAAIASASTQRRLTVTAVRDLKGGLSNSNFAFSVRCDSLGSGGSGGHSMQLLIKICEEKSHAEVELQTRALALIRHISSDSAVRLAHSEFQRPLPIAYPIAAGGCAAEGEAKAEAKRDGDDVDAGSQWVDRCDPQDRFVFFCPAVTNRPIVAYQFLSGSVPRAPASTQLMAEIARVQAQLHSIPLDLPGRDLQFLSQTPFGMFAIEQRFEAQVVSLPASDPLRQHPFVFFLKPLLAEVARTADVGSSLPQGVLHCDLFLENTLQSPGSGAIHLIDFEEMGRGPRVLDVAMTLVGCCYTEKNRLDLTLTSAFLRSYQRFTPLTADERTHFVAFLQWAILAIAYWRFQAFNLANPQEARKDAYLDMQRRVEELRRSDGEAVSGMLRNDAEE